MSEIACPRKGCTGKFGRVSASHTLPGKVDLHASCLACGHAVSARVDDPFFEGDRQPLPRHRPLMKEPKRFTRPAELSPEELALVQAWLEQLDADQVATTNAAPPPPFQGLADPDEPHDPENDHAPAAKFEASGDPVEAAKASTFDEPKE